jgi:hypothetical protein
MTYLIPDRKAVAQLKYQLRRFEKQCSELPASTRLRVQQTMLGLRQLLQAVEEEQYPKQDPDYVGWGCRGLGLDHRWQKSEFSDKVFCTKCGEPDDEPENY